MSHLYSNKRFVFIIRFFTFLCICVFPLIELLRVRLNKNFDNGFTEIVYVQTGDVLKQSLFVDNGVKLKETIAKVIVPDNNSSALKAIVTVTQGNRSYSREYYAYDNSVITIIDKNMNFRANGEPIEATIEIDDIYGNGKIGFELGENIYGLPTCHLNQEEQNLPLHLTGKTKSLNYTHVRYSLISMVVIIILLVMLSWLMTYRSNHKHYNTFFMLSVIALIVAIISFLYPLLTWKGTDHAESILFYHDAVSQDWWRSFAELEGGMYLSIYNRLLMLLVTKMLPTSKYVFVVAQVINTFIIALIASLICAPYYRKYFSDDARLILSVVLGCFICTSSLYWFVATPYFGIVLLFYALTNDFQDNWLTFAITCIGCGIFCMSKMMYVVFFPICTFLLIFFRNRFNEKKKIIMFVIVIFTLLEAALSVLFRGSAQSGNWGSLGTIHYLSGEQLIIASGYYTVQMFISTILQGGNLYNQALINLIFSSLLLILVSWCVLEIILRKRYQQICFFILFCFAVVTGTCALHLLSNDNLPTLGINLLNVHYISIGPETDRWWWYTFSFFSVGAIGLALLYVGKQELINRLGLNDKTHFLSACEVILVAFLSIGIIAQYSPVGEKWVSYLDKSWYGNFRDYAQLQKKDNFFILSSDLLQFNHSQGVKVSTVYLPEATSSIALTDLIEEDFYEIADVYVHKNSRANQLSPCRYWLNAYDQNGNLLVRIEQLDRDRRREHIGFDFDPLLAGAKYLEFVCDNAVPALIDKDVFIAIKD